MIEVRACQRVEEIGEIWMIIEWAHRGIASAGPQLINVLFKDKAKTRTTQMREAERDLWRGLASLQREQEANPDSPWTEAQITQA